MLQTILEGHTDWLTSCAFSSGGTHVVTASKDQTARTWDAAMGALQTPLGGRTSNIWCCAFSCALQTTALDLRLLMLEGHSESVTSCAFSGDDTRVVTASDDKTAKIWDAKTGALQTTLEGHSGVS